MKIMIIHPGTQHSAKLTAAIKSSGYEAKLVTTVYNKKKSLVNKLFQLLSKSEQKRVTSRMNNSLSDDDVIVFSEFLGLVLLLIGRIDKKKKIYAWLKRLIAKKVGVKAAKRAIKEGYDIVISFDSYAEYPFSYLEKKKSSIVKIMDCSAAYAKYAKDIYLKQMALYPQLTETLKADRCTLWNNKYYNEMLHEPFLADSIICASKYTMRTLVENGVDEKKISVIPYGYNPVISELNEKTDEIFNILYVGGVNVMKGIPFLISAFKSIRNKNVRLTLVGNYQDVIQNMCISDDRIRLKGYIPHNEIHNEYINADLFVFPSLSDGFGFAPLEAMSYGVVCAVSDSSGICDIIDDKENGFVFKSESELELKEIIEKCLNKEYNLSDMRIMAKKRASECKEVSYSKSIALYLEKICSARE